MVGVRCQKLKDVTAVQTAIVARVLPLKFLLHPIKTVSPRRLALVVGSVLLIAEVAKLEGAETGDVVAAFILLDYHLAAGTHLEVVSSGQSLGLLLVAGSLVLNL